LSALIFYLYLGQSMKDSIYTHWHIRTSHLMKLMSWSLK